MIETRTEKIWIGEDEIVHIEAKPVEKHLLEDAYENMEALLLLANGKQYPLLLDIRKAQFVSSEARNLYTSDSNTSVKACAILVDSPVSKLIGNFFIGLNKGSARFPTKLFNSKNTALDWLNTATNE